MPPYVIFSDLTLRELARVRPTTPEALRQVTGIGEAKARDLGPLLLQVLGRHQAGAGLRVGPDERPQARGVPAVRRRGDGRAGDGEDRAGPQHGGGYLAEYIAYARPESLTPWGIDDVMVRRVLQAAREVGGTQLRPVFLKLGEQVSYDVIKCVLALGREVEDY